MTSPTKSAFAAAALPAMVAIDWYYAVAVAFGLVTGVFCRAAVPFAQRKPWADIRHSLILSLMIFGGSLLATLWVANMMNASALGAAVVGWAVAFGGLDSLTLMQKFVLRPIRQALSEPEDDGMAEHRQQLAREEAARRLSAKQETSEQIEETMKRLMRAEKRRRGEGPPLPSDVPPEDEKKKDEK